MGAAVDRIFRLNGAVPQDPAVAEWMHDHPGELGTLAQTYFDRVRACGPDVCELMHDGCPTACVGDVALAYVNAFTHHANLGFFRGVELQDPARLLEGSGKLMRHVKLKPGVPLNSDAVLALIQQAYRNVKALQ